ncbi:MAG: sulfatase-like hydrolase/transferase [Rickettsiales bacterium]|jgi:lipid A ethanolaminephosphotransferase|nr:sulfatase-like hydrolase/transferase [Rickettsiales bacterium]
MFASLVDNFKKFDRWQLKIPHWVYLQMFTVVNLLLYSRPFFIYFLQKRQFIAPWAFYPTVLLFYLFFGALLNVIFLIILRYPGPKIMGVLILMINSVCLHFMNLYGIQIDVYMVINVFETNGKEIVDLINSRLFLHMFLMGVLPSIFLIRKIKITEENPKSSIAFGSASLAIAALFLFSGVFPKKSRRFLRAENRYTMNHVIPTNYILAVGRFVSIKIKKLIFSRKIIAIGEDAKISYRTKINGKKNLIIIIIGESARSQNFSLNGYGVKTNEPLERFNVISYRNTYSCGTSTAHSIPCIFSHKSKSEFNPLESKKYENVLDIFKKFGFGLLWLSNNGDCKGVCGRIKYLSTKNLDINNFDRSLTVALRRAIVHLDRENNIIILNQRGSHEPYHERYPAEMEKFKPSCKKNEDQCSLEELTNGYDNSIYYSSLNSSEILDLLVSKENEYNSMLLYVSDHGTGLGEDGIWTHGMPYDVANDYVKKVPMFLWFSSGFLEEFRIDTKCLGNMIDDKLAHDNLFHSLLGLYGIESRYYRGDLDIFKNCRVKDR